MFAVANGDQFVARDRLVNHVMRKRRYLRRRFKHFDKHKLAAAVVKFHAHIMKHRHAADRIGIGDCAVKIVALKKFAVSFHTRVKRLHVEKLFGRL